jgi:peptide/nickel transport system ATP-binding protein/oligopeptide transport system ATP-binding protein
MTAMLDVQDLRQEFCLNPGLLDRISVKGGRLHLNDRTVSAVNGVSFSIAKGEVLALVGESGCGKSTVAKAIARIYSPTSGAIRLDGADIARLTQTDLLPHRSKMQMIFQDPFASLDPRQKVRDIVAEPLRAQSGLGAGEVAERVASLLAKVGLNSDHAGRYPHQFSGGQRQRIGIARALSVNPGLIIADEPVSALDVSVQAQILNLMMDLRDEFGLAYLFISHDLSVVHHIADRIGVMYLGFMVETAPRDQLFASPRHPYTRALLSAAPSINTARSRPEIELRGEVPSALSLPSGCCFRTRCPYAWDRCAQERPTLRDLGDGHSVACHLTEEPQRDRP